MSSRIKGLASGLGAVILVASLGACSTPEAVPTDLPGITFDRRTADADGGADQGQGDGGDKDQGEGDGTGDGGPGDGGPGDGGRDVIVVVDASCYALVKEGSCASCATPATDPQFLNQCTAATCQAFDNASRLPRLEPGGGLPPLE